MGADLDAAADELYSIAPADLDAFMPRRGELAAAAKAAGDRDLAKAITGLKKPILAAAVVNALVHSEHRALIELSELAGELREAHRNLRGPELRALSERRQQVLGKLSQLAHKAAGRSVGESVLGQLRATFEAAIADEAAEQAVLSGRLTAALSYSGFGEVDLSEAVATPPRRLRAVPDLPEEKDETGSEDSDPAERRRAVRALERATSAADKAQEALSQAADRLEQARQAETEATGRVKQLTRELAEAREAVAETGKASATADREHARAQRAAERAEHARELAESDIRQYED
jgi:hypothetical protein